MNDSSPHIRRTVRLAGATVLALLATLLHIRLSQLIGRLRYDITYDDISYVDDATSRLWILLDQGAWRFITDLASNSPHSPFSSLLAMAAMVLGGFHDAVFYAANGVILVAIAVFLVREFGDLDGLAMAWILAVSLLSPLAFATIENFRPDMALGVATSAMAWWFLAALVRHQRRSFFLAGSALGAALLIKPTFFAHTLALAGALCAIAVAHRVWERVHDKAQGPANWAGPAVFVLTGTILAAPYYIVAGDDVFNYFWSNTSGGSAHLWSVPSEIPILHTAYLFLFGGYQRTFGHLWIPVLVLGAIAVTLLGRRRAWSELAILLALVAVAGLSFSILVIGRHKNEFFFSSFQFLLLLAVLHGFAAVYRIARRRGRILLVASAWLCLAAALHLTSTSPHIDRSEDGLKSASQNERIVDVIEQALARRPGNVSRKDPVPTLVSVAGPVNALSLRWTATKRMLPIRVHDMHREERLESFVNRAKASQFVVVPHLLRADFARDMPSASIQVALIQELVASPDFRLLNADDKASYYSVYERIRGYRSQDYLFDDRVVLSIPGFGPEEGPYPDLGLPRVAWMRSSKAAICLHEEGIYKVVLTFRPSHAGTLSARTPRQGVVASTTLKPDKFSTLNFHANVGGDSSCVDLEIRDSAAPHAGNPIILVKARFERQGKNDEAD